MKIRNKLAIFIVATLMASSAIVVSASAISEKVINDVFQDAAVKATLHFDDLGDNHMAIASTEYAKSGRVFVALDVDDYITGKLIKRCNRTEGEKSISVTAIYPLNGSRHSLYSSHEVIVGNHAWGEYLQAINV